MKAALAQSDNMKKVYIRGGIGDFLQSFGVIQSNQDDEYLVHTHFKGAKQIFDFLGAKNAKFYFFDDFDSHNSQVELIMKENCPDGDQSKISEAKRLFYGNFQFSFESEEMSLAAYEAFEKEQTVIGIHPFRSEFAMSVYDDHKLPAKTMPSYLVKKIIKPDYNYFIFGRNKDFENYDLNESDNVKFISFENILTSLNTVKYCKKFIGIDSCFKTMSSMQKIPTFCIIGNFQDSIRDAFFINQYVLQGYMKAFKLSDWEKDEAQLMLAINEYIYKKEND